MIVRLIKRLVGIDAVDYWRQRHEGTLALLADLQAKAHEALAQKQSEAISHQENARRQAAGWASAQAELAALRRLLVFEQTARGLYEQVVMEAAEQIGKNSDVAPKTLMSVLRTVFVEATATVEGWRQGAPIDGPMVTNLRATMANRLLPDPKQGTIPPGRASNRIETTRNRTGKAGDSASRADPDRPHVFEWTVFGPAEPDKAVCGRCQKPLSDAIHSMTVGWARSAPDPDRADRILDAVAEAQARGLEPHRFVMSSLREGCGRDNCRLPAGHPIHITKLPARDD